MLEFETKAHLLVKGLVSLLKILLYDGFLIQKISIVLFELLYLLVHLYMLLLVQLLTRINYLLASLDLLLHDIQLPQLIPFDLPNHSLKLPLRTILQQHSIHPPQGLPNSCGL